MGGKSPKQNQMWKSYEAKVCLKMSILKTNILCQAIKWFSGNVIHILLPELSKKVIQETNSPSLACKCIQGQSHPEVRM